VDELVAFLRAALDRDAGWAAAASRVEGPSPAEWVAEKRTVHNASGSMRVAEVAGSPVQAEHIARWDPARVLAEVKAKRRILELHEPIHGYDANGPVCSTCGETSNPGDETVVVRWPCPTIRALAQPYAGQDGWQEEWQLSVDG
jgi:hypothetical protein